MICWRQIIMSFRSNHMKIMLNMFGMTSMNYMFVNKGKLCLLVYLWLPLIVVPVFVLRVAAVVTSLSLHKMNPQLSLPFTKWNTCGFVCLWMLFICGYIQALIHHFWHRTGIGIGVCLWQAFKEVWVGQINTHQILHKNSIFCVEL